MAGRGHHDVIRGACAGADHGQPGRAQRRAIIALSGQRQRDTQHRGQQGDPVTRLRPAPDGQHLVQSCPACLQGFGTVAQAKGHALHHRAGHVAPVGRHVNVQKSAPDAAVIMGCAFPRQIGQKAQHTRPARIRAHLLRQDRRRSPGDARQPVHAVGGRQHYAHLIPLPRKRMTKRVHSTFRQGRIAIAPGQNHAGCPQRHKPGPVSQRPHTAGRGRVIACPTDHADLARHPPAGRQIGAQHAARLATFDQSRHLIRAHP